MTEIRFYHLQRRSLEDVLPVMLERCVNRDRRRAVVLAPPERVRGLNTYLWTYNDRAFLPHGTADDGFAEDQPIWLTDRDENPNGATALFLADGAVSARPDDYALVCELFDGNDPDAVTAARARWTAYREAGHDLTYWAQDDGGRWTRKGQA